MYFKCSVSPAALSPLDGVSLVLPVDPPVHVLRVPRVDGGVLGGGVSGARLLIIRVRTLLRIPGTGHGIL